MKYPYTFPTANYATTLHHISHRINFKHTCMPLKEDAAKVLQWHFEAVRQFLNH